MELRQRVLKVIDHVRDGKSLEDSTKFEDVEPAIFFSCVSVDKSLNDLYQNAKRERSEYFADQIVEMAEIEERPTRREIRVR
jgi:hypothetical protein